MARKQNRISTAPERDALVDSPFAAGLAHLKGDLPEAPKAPPPAPAPASPVSWTVTRTRKGGLPVAVERRGSGKVVTVIRNLQGDTKSLLRELRKTCGAGGAVREDTVEIQGNHVEAIERFLRESMK